MGQLTSNSILVVDPDLAYGVQLKEILEARGAMVTLSHNFKTAQKALHRSDFDLIISAFTFQESTIKDLIQWCKDYLSSMPEVAAMGNCTQLEKKQLQKMGVRSFFSKMDSIKLISEISTSLFSIEEYKQNFLSSRFENGILYELKVGDKKFVVKALEIMEKGIFLSFEAPFIFGNEASLHLTSSEKLSIESVSVNGVLQGENPEGQFFKVQESDIKKWENLLSQLNRKQGEVTEFLKKAAGK